MDARQMIKVCIYWRTNDKPTKDKIRKRFGIPQGETVNGETVCEINEEDYPLLQETARRGFIQLRNKKI